MFTVEKVSALEILDSRGRPTVKATCILRDGTVASASVPSGASTGTAEAIELRDGDPKRYQGLGCRKAVANINGEIDQALRGRTFRSQEELDLIIRDLDGTENKSRLGANAQLAVSLAFARACAHARQVPLYRHFADIMEQPLRTLPRPTINLFSGGKHAGELCPLQDLLIVPASATTMDQALADTFAVYQSAAKLIAKKYGMRALSADEGGLAPVFPNPEAMFADAVEAIQQAGLRPGEDVALAVDVASSHFHTKAGYQLGERLLDGPAMIGQLAQWAKRYPLVSLEDGLSEDDWDHWPKLRETLSGKVRVVGDDLLCTNPKRIRKAVELGAVDTLLLKVNQIGSLSEAKQACLLARSAGWQVTISARSGETEDNWLADLAVGWAGDQIKVGSITQSERLSKYNRLLEIEAETRLPMVAWPLSAGVPK
ncbi:MAG: enolase [Methylacidiphilales bacterium]|nr:enolase [Candidatus Methylacidiphilales bacterium]